MGQLDAIPMWLAYLTWVALLVVSAYGRCIEQGATYIICHPFFLSKGRHVVEDIPALMQQASAMYPGNNLSPPYLPTYWTPHLCM